MRMVIEAVLVLFLAGCGTGLTQAPSNAKTLCDEYQERFGNISYATIKSGTEILREEGFTKLQLMAATAESCLEQCPFSQECLNICLDCNIAVIDEVYD